MKSILLTSAALILVCGDTFAQSAVAASWNVGQMAAASTRDSEGGCPRREKTTTYERPNVAISSTECDVNAAIALTIDHIRELRDEYQGTAHHPGKIAIKTHWQTVWDSALIALGIGSVATAFYGAPINAIGGVAIAAGGAQQYRAYYNPGDQALVYIKAVKAARCVASNAEPLLNDSPEYLWTAIKSLNKAIYDVQIASAGLQSVMPDAAATAVDQTKAGQQKAVGATATTDALSAANNALIGALAEARAYNDAPAKIDQAHDQIKDYVELALHRTRVDYSSVQTALTNAINNAAKVQTSVQQAQMQLVTAAKSSAQASASAGANPGGTAPMVDMATNLANASALPTNFADHFAGAALPAAAAPATVAMAAQNSAGAVANLIAATTNVVNLITDHRYTTIDTTVAVTCVGGLSS